MWLLVLYFAFLFLSETIHGRQIFTKQGPISLHPAITPLNRLKALNNKPSLLLNTIQPSNPNSKTFQNLPHSSLPSRQSLTNNNSPISNITSYPTIIKQKVYHKTQPDPFHLTNDKTITNENNENKKEIVNFSCNGVICFDISDDCLNFGNCYDNIPFYLKPNSQFGSETQQKEEKILHKSSFTPEIESSSSCENNENINNEKNKNQITKETTKCEFSQIEKQALHDIIPDKSQIENRYIQSRETYPTVILYGMNIADADIPKITQNFSILFNNSTKYIRVLPFSPKSKSLSEGIIQNQEALCGILDNDENLKIGFNLIGFGIGGVIGRTFLEMCPTQPRVRNLISICAPQGGVTNPKPLACAYDVTSCQSTISNTLTQDLKYSNDCEQNFINILNNKIPSNQVATQKQQIIDLDNFVLVMCENDEAIVPKQSALFGTENNIYLEQTQMYKEDTLGLKYLLQKGKLHRFMIANATHLHDPFDLQFKRFYQNNILPFLSQTDQNLNND
eukprot:c21666_g1_i1.p1 GENE.c21666_g1_i1~~c21666_g1_i1.p1  ORF type:complete len:507 (-),score=158.47 c21666_g1_i1:34-1554(-)